MASHDVSKRGFRGVGSTVCYAFMQTVGILNDHVKTAAENPELAGGIAHAEGTPTWAAAECRQVWS